MSLFKLLRTAFILIIHLPFHYPSPVTMADQHYDQQGYDQQGYDQHAYDQQGYYQYDQQQMNPGMHNQTYDPQSVGFDMSNQQEQFPQDT
jgi:hypothetical protein